ncbi:hypothetical protein [Streptomyces tubercidicus]|uniref:hypothetical protein n=1 Tax=Streptomyces tubercidicus TaxID=47759 RepID=UPI003466DBD7
MADSAEIVEPTSPPSDAAGPGGSARSAGPDRPAPREGAGPGRGDELTLIMDWLGTLVGLLQRPRGLEVD